LKIALYHNLPSGGALGHLCEVAKALKDHGHTLLLFCPSSAEQNFGDLSKIVDESIVFHRTPWTPIFPILNPMLYRTYLGQQLTDEKTYVSHIMAHQPDGIYLGQCRLWTEPPLLRYLPKALPKILYCAEPKRSFYEPKFIAARKKWPWWKKMWRLPTIEWMKAEMHETIQAADLVLCNSNYSKNTISKVYKGIEPLFTAIGVDVNFFKPDPHLQKKRQLISVGALDPSKNHDMVIKTAALLPKSLGFKVTIITDRSYGETATDLKSLATSLNVNLTILERISLNDLRTVYQESFATIYCPDLEPFGRVSIESQACGTPVLGKNEGGLKETIVEGKSGYCFESEPEPYARAIETWVERPQDYLNLCQSARAHIVDHWNQGETLVNHVSLLESHFRKK